MRWLVWLSLLVACEQVPAAFVRLADARRLAAALETELAQSGEAASRTVVQDATGPAAVREVRQALQRDFAQLEPIVRGLSYEPELALLTRLRAELEADRQLEEQLLALTGEGSNLAAQRLSFGEAHAAVDRFHAALGASLPAAAYALRSIEALEGPHIAEADEARMTVLERQMDALLHDARAALSETHAPEADAALRDFLAVHQRILALSRRNTNVHALALAVGDKRASHDAAARTLRELQERLQARASPVTR